MKTTKEFTKKDLVGREQAAKILGVTKTMLDIYRGRGYLNPVPTVGFRTYFLRSEVLAFKRQRMIKLRKQAKEKAQAEKPAIQNQISHENNKS